MKSSGVMLNLSSDRAVAEPGAARVLARCEQLAKISSIDTGICRTYLTPEHERCNRLIQNWMAEAGMVHWQDNAGNCWGRYGDTGDSQVQSLILGSHLDTVTNAGKYDGILGVLCAIEVVDFFSKNGLAFPFSIDVVGFGDEEGTRFGATLLGSRAVAGTWNANWFDLQDKNNVSLRSAMQEFGLQPENVYLADRSDEGLLAYLELHIEQGPVLEEHNLPVGIVTAIAGARRFSIQLEGTAGHAGTVPMNMRRDPLVAAAQVILEIEQIARSNDILATVGSIEAFPSAVNVIPGACEFSLDIRSGDDSQRDNVVKEIFTKLASVCRERDIHYKTTEIHNASAVKCASWIQALTKESVLEQGYSPFFLTSGAGHDAMAFDGVTDIGMLFVRCAGGLSHHPEESVSEADVDIALSVLKKMIEKFRVQA